jgi:hypothetical protein
MLLASGFQNSVSQHADFSFAKGDYVKRCVRKVYGKSEIASVLN